MNEEMGKTADEYIRQFGPLENWKYHPTTGRPLRTGMQNFKNLFRKPTFSDWITLFIIVMALIGTCLYFQETKVCRETLQNLPTICAQYKIFDENQADGPFSSLANVSGKINLIVEENG